MSQPGVFLGESQYYRSQSQIGVQSHGSGPQQSSGYPCSEGSTVCLHMQKLCLLSLICILSYKLCLVSTISDLREDISLKYIPVKSGLAIGVSVIIDLYNLISKEGVFKNMYVFLLSPTFYRLQIKSAPVLCSTYSSCNGHKHLQLVRAKLWFDTKPGSGAGLCVLLREQRDQISMLWGIYPHLLEFPFHAG